MPVASKINELAARKRLLVAESDLNRQALTLELCTITQKTARFERWALLGWKAYPIFQFGVRLAKTFATRKHRSDSSSRLSIISRSLQLAGVVLRALRQ